ncbi:MAG TPA: hypothetical protein VGQ83_03735 [Polyangia bacterium]
MPRANEHCPFAVGRTPTRSCSPSPRLPVFLSAALALAACGPALPAVEGGPRAATIALEVPVERATFGEGEVHLTLGAPLAGEARFRFDRCEWVGTGRQRLDRACIGHFSLHTAHGRLTGSARSLWTGYRALLAVYGEVRVGHGCLAGVSGGGLERQGPVSFPQLPARVRLVLPPGAELGRQCVAVPRAPDLASAVAAARAADPAASGAALTALAAALASPRDEVRAAALATIGFAASDPIYAAFRAALDGNAAAITQLDEARGLRAGGAAPLAPDCAQPAPADDETGPLLTAACQGFDRARVLLVAGLGSEARQVRRAAARLLAWAGQARARPLFEDAIRRAIAAGDLTAAVDLAEALLLAPR